MQHVSTSYVVRLEQIGAHLNMSEAGNPCDNAEAESFFKTLKHEDVYHNDYQAFAETEAQIGQFIEAVYNAKQLHSSPGYVPPTESETTCSLPE